MKSLLNLTAAAAVLTFSTYAAAQVREVKLSSWLPPASPVNSEGYVPFIKALEADPASGMKFRFFVAGSLLEPRATVPGIRDGVADGGLVVFAYHPAEFPHIATFADLSMVGTDSLVAGAAVSETVLLHCAPCLAELKKQNILFFGAYATGPYNILSRTPINTVEDMKGKKVRSMGGAADRWLRAVGAVPVTVEGTMTYEGLAKKTLDITLLPIADIQGQNLWDVVPYVTNAHVGSFKASSTVGFNRDFWRSLSLDQRKTLLKHAPLMVYGPGMGYKKQDNDVIALSKSKNVTMIPGSDALKASLATFAANDAPAIVETARKRGVQNPEAIVNKYKELVAKYDTLFKGKHTDPAALNQILQQEIYSKLDPAQYGLD